MMTHTNHPEGCAMKEARPWRRCGATGARGHPSVDTRYQKGRRGGSCCMPMAPIVQWRSCSCSGREQILRGTGRGPSTPP